MTLQNKQPLIPDRHNPYTVVTDEAGNALLVDKRHDHWFAVVDHPYRKTIYVQDEHPMVLDLATRIESGVQAKYIPLAVWIWECEYEMEAKSTWDIVQKEPRNDYRICNLEKVLKPRKQKVA